MPTRLTVNGQPLAFALPPELPLLWALREGANLTAAKYACGTGECGACTVLIDGEAQASCQISLGQSEGRGVVTLEGLSGDATHPVQIAFAQTQAVLCGFCTPGMVLAISALLARDPLPTDEAVGGAIGNLCRCGAYHRIRAAIRNVAPLPADSAVPESPPAEPQPEGDTT